jgi:uncharacterized membrane protein YcaP (DUF421 family)
MEVLKDLLGLGIEPGEMNVLQVCARAVVVFFSALLIVRVSNRRFLAKLTPLDVILGFVLASLLARSINGSGPLFQSIAAGFLLVFLHRGLAALAFRTHFFGNLVKGSPHVLVEDGEISWQALGKHNITKAGGFAQRRRGG